MGPCTANALRPTVDSRCRGTTISCCVADLRRCLPTTSCRASVGCRPAAGSDVAAGRSGRARLGHTALGAASRHRRRAAVRLHRRAAGQARQGGGGGGGGGAVEGGGVRRPGADLVDARRTVARLRVHVPRPCREPGRRRAGVHAAVGRRAATRRP